MNTSLKVAVIFTLCLSIVVDAESGVHKNTASSEQKQISTAVSHVLEANKEFVHKHKASYFLPFIHGQTPKATVVTCADSRVHSHAIDPYPDGDLFMVRDIGNQVASAKGSIEYGVRHLHTPLLLIVGHSMCGAVKAAMSDYSSMEPAIKAELSTIHVSPGNPSDPEQIKNAVEENVNDQVALATQLFAAELNQKKLIIIGAVYDFRNDYKKGYGRLIFTNVNGKTEPKKIKQLLIHQKKVITK